MEMVEELWTRKALTEEKLEMSLQQLVQQGQTHPVGTIRCASHGREFDRWMVSQAGVKALAWSPFTRNLLVSGGGTCDGRIRFWYDNLSADFN